MKYIDAERLKTFVQARKDMHYNHYVKTGVGCIAEYKYDEDVELLDLIVSLQQEPIEKDEEIEKLIVCDIIEATIARINGGKKDEEKEENIMREKIAYLRDLGLKARKED